MSSLAQTTPKTNPAPKAYRAHLYDEPGVLTKVDGEIVFLVDATDELTVIEPFMCPFLTTLGEIGLSETQRIMDQIRGDLVQIACSRNN